MKKNLFCIFVIFIFFLQGCKGAKSSDEFISTDEITNEKTIIDPHSCNHLQGSAYSFHIIETDFINYVGWENYTLWLDSEHESKAECYYFGINIYYFIKYFNIPKEVFVNIYNNSTSMAYMRDYNIELLYGGNEEELYKYYENGGRNEETKKLTFVLDVKNKLISDFVLKNLKKQDENFDRNQYLKFSIPQLIYDFAVTREDFENIVLNLNSPYRDIIEVINENGEKKLMYSGLVFSFDYDKIYNNKNEILKLINEGNPIYIIDNLVSDFTLDTSLIKEVIITN